MIKNTIQSSHVVVGVIAGTMTDTQFGLNYLESQNTVGFGLSISHTPQAQTNLQALDRITLTELVEQTITTLVNEGVNCIMIYCNSLSGAIDLERIHAFSPVPVVTPLEVYQNLTHQYRNFGLLAANCQSCANIEKNILATNPTAKVIGIGNLQIVEDIEAGLDPDMIVNLHALRELTSALVKSGVQILILGCTHFDYIYDALDSVTHDIRLFLPSEKMLENLQRRVEISPTQLSVT
ncbi:aspartate/glutamate racemase family protein [Aestuariibacter sp. AA17]|uniref:Aspartate/glutamate racemase family protein n=1 Tax=Fluctibacter corallii TaxID=2984329 RepID=A0ABT3AC35_9ALTE|nr:aspartate/glutamate racemase family protein [Aestuariibacter sp. AA17]MCV2885847.1 aspartate/glutamate racemase family protein [Aestuariibacter sp. AA17]